MSTALLGALCIAPDVLAGSRMKMALVIDDFGENLNLIKEFLRLNIPLTFAVLPRLRHSVDIANIAHSAGHEVILHQPMENTSRRLNPGPGALFIDDSPEKIIRTLEVNISSIPFIKGVNNHEGSKFTTYEKEMMLVLKVIDSHGLYFIDSGTSSKTVGYKVAKYLGMPTAKVDDFVDHWMSPDRIRSSFYNLKRIGAKKGSVLGIGHDRQMTIANLKYLVKDLDIQFIYASEFIAITKK
jgi:polysaccharide deacetylase 2 family uncharacterized protein YibQ